MQLVPSNLPNMPRPSPIYQPLSAILLSPLHFDPSELADVDYQSFPVPKTPELLNFNDTWLHSVESDSERAKTDGMTIKAGAMTRSFTNPLLHCIAEAETSHDTYSEASTVASLSPTTTNSPSTPSSTVASSVYADSPSRPAFQRTGESIEDRRCSPDMPGSWIEDSKVKVPTVTVTGPFARAQSINVKDAEPNKRRASPSPSRAQEIAYFSAKRLPCVPHVLVSSSSSSTTISSLNHGTAKAAKEDVADAMPTSESSSTTTTLTLSTWDGGHLTMKRPLSIVSLHESFVSSDSGRSRSLSLRLDNSSPDLLMIRPPQTPVVVYQANHGSMPLLTSGSTSSAPNVPTKKSLSDSLQLQPKSSKDSLRSLFKRRGGVIGRIFTSRSFHSAHSPEPKSA